MFKIKPLRFFITALAINLILFMIIYALPFNPFQMLIGHFVSAFVFIFGIKLLVIRESSAYFLTTPNGKMMLYQTFYEFLTITALTIPLYLKSWKKLLKKLSIILFIMFSYYTILYSITIILLENGINATLLIKFISFNTESFMIFAFTILWFLVNKKEIIDIIKNENSSPSG